jgi:hypothetical protein
VRGRAGTPVVRITGEPGEIALYLNGRKSVAQVELSGDPEAVHQVETADMGI